MNTIIHLAALLASLWGSVFGFQELQEPALGGALLAFFFAYLALTINALDDDLFLAFGKKIFGFKGSERRAISYSSMIAVGVTLLVFTMGVANHISEEIAAAL